MNAMCVYVIWDQVIFEKCKRLSKIPTRDIFKFFFPKSDHILPVISINLKFKYAATWPWCSGKVVWQSIFMQQQHIHVPCQCAVGYCVTSYHIFVVFHRPGSQAGYKGGGYQPPHTTRSTVLGTVQQPTGTSMESMVHSSKNSYVRLLIIGVFCQMVTINSGLFGNHNLGGKIMSQFIFSLSNVGII